MRKELGDRRAEEDIKGDRTFLFGKCMPPHPPPSLRMYSRQQKERNCITLNQEGKEGRGVGDSVMLKAEREAPEHVSRCRSQV